MSKKQYNKAPLPLEKQAQLLLWDSPRTEKNSIYSKSSKIENSIFAEKSMAKKKDCHGPWHCKAGERITWLTIRIYGIIDQKSRIGQTDG